MGLSINDIQQVLITDDAFIPVGTHVDGPSISTAQTLTQPDGATKLLMQALGQNVRYTLDGTTPTATKGFQLKAESLIFIKVGFGMTIKVIEETATADLQYQWGR